MKINQNISIHGEKIILIPYREDHVPKYHEWMKDPEIQELTASEPLTIQEEYEMQKSWATDEDKCTFIILDQNKYNQNQNEVDSMIGDVNIFLTDPENNKHLGEIEIMIADPSFRGCGKGKEALLFMIRYGIEQLDLTSIIAKIKMKNSISLNIFQKLGFVLTSSSEIFQEHTLTREVDSDWITDLKVKTSSYLVASYPFKL